MNIPSTHQTVMPYLMLTKAQDFITFTSDVFGAELISKRMREDNHTIMHAELSIGASTIMFSEANEQWKPQTANMFVYVEDADHVYAKALEAGGVSVMELSNQDYGRTCGVADPFGNVWWITTIVNR